MNAPKIVLTRTPDGGLGVNCSGGLFGDADSLSELRRSRPAAFRELVARLNAENIERLNSEFKKLP
jgi:hypothetical protein